MFYNIASFFVIQIFVFKQCFENVGYDYTRVVVISQFSVNDRLLNLLLEYLDMILMQSLKAYFSDMIVLILTRSHLRRALLTRSCKCRTRHI